MKLSRLFIIPLTAASILAGCDDSSSTLGSSLVSDSIEIVIDSSFTITGRSLTDLDIQSRTVTQLIGRLEAKGFGSLRSDVVTQFMPAQNISFTGVDSVEVDSIRMLMFIKKGEFTGDSLMPMGVKVYRLNRQLPSPIYNTFNPDDYYSPDDLIGQTIYTGVENYNDSVANLAYNTIAVTLDRQLAVDLMQQYRDSSDIFYSPATFAEWFPGVYVANSFGNGRVSQVSETRINLYYRTHQKVVTDSTTRDTVLNQIQACLAVTPEVITNNNFSLKLDPAITARIDAGESIIASPAGSDVEITLPTAAIVKRFREYGGDLAVFNSMSLEVPADSIPCAQDYGIDPAPTLLMVLKNKKKEFFAKNQIADNTSSFFASYNSTTGKYSFTGMRAYLMDMLEKDSITADDCTFVLTPIEVTSERVSEYSTETVITGMTPYIAQPTLAKINIDSAKITISYSKLMLDF